jgi:hypothetical protein
MTPEKLEHCPDCGSELTQVEYDFQFHGDHWDAAGLAPKPPATPSSRRSRRRS